MEESKKKTTTKNEDKRTYNDGVDIIRKKTIYAATPTMCIMLYRLLNIRFHHSMAWSNKQTEEVSNIKVMIVECA